MMNNQHWNELKSWTGEGLSLFTVFMAFIKASEIIDGMKKSVKGFEYLSDETVTEMQQEMLAGLCRETLRSKYSSLPFNNDQLSTDLFVCGLNDLMSQINEKGQEEMDPWFDYICRWDLSGHDWNRESPLSLKCYSNQLETSMLS